MQKVISSLQVLDKIAVIDKVRRLLFKATMSRPSKEEAEEAVWPESAELISSLFLQASYGSGMVHIASGLIARTKSKVSFVVKQPSINAH